MAIATTSLNKLMVYTVGQKPRKRRSLVSNAQSIMLYETNIWTDTRSVWPQIHRNRMVSVKIMGSLRVVCAFRTVSHAVVLVMVGRIPIDPPTYERQ